MASGVPGEEAVKSWRDRSARHQRVVRTDAAAATAWAARAVPAGQHEFDPTQEGKALLG